MANHEYFTCKGANSRYSAVELSPLDKALRELKEKGYTILDISRMRDGRWHIKTNSPKDKDAKTENG